MISGSCIGIGIVAIATGVLLVGIPFVISGLAYGYAALKEAGAL
jgi:hypothetical protein